MPKNKLLWARRGGEAHGRAARWGEAGQNGTPAGRFAQETTISLAAQGNQYKYPGISPEPNGRTNKTLRIQTEWRNTIIG